MNKPYKTGDERRHSTMSFRVSRTQRQHIEKLADECGMNLSGYLISRAYGYRPKARLTRAQEAVRNELIIARSDYANIPRCSTLCRRKSAWLCSATSLG